MANLDKFLFVGDSFTTGLEAAWDKKYGENVKFYAKVGRTATELRELLEKGKANLPKESEINGVCLLIGINNCLGAKNKPNTKNQEDVIQCIKLLKNKYRRKKIYVQRVFPVCSKYDKNYKGGWKNVNAAVKDINLKNKKHCDVTDGVYYIDATKGFSNNAVLVDSKTADGLHILPAQYPNYIKNIDNAISNINTDNSSDGGNGYPPLIKKLLPDSLAGKSYETSGFTPQFIAIHNMGGGGESTNQLAYNFWSNGSDGRYTSAHYCVEPGEIWQTLENTWIGHHIGSGCKGNPGYDAGARNNNTLGIEMADGDNIDKDAALENMIELTRHLMKTFDIPLKNIYNHHQISGNKTDCPWWIRKHKKWDYFLEEVEKRNKNNDPIKLNLNPSETGTDSNVSNVGTLPNFDNREDLINIEEVKGVVLVHMPPYHFYSKKAKDEVWEEQHYDRNFHFEVDSAGFKTKVDNSLITWGMQPDDKHTYIDRALFRNKPYKYVLNIGLFTSEELKDYTATEKILIDKIGKVLWENGLETKDL